MQRIGLLFLMWTFVLGCGPANTLREAAQNPNPNSKTPRVARSRIERGPVAVTVEVTPSPARLSDEPQLVLTVEHEPGIEIQKPPFGDAVGDFIVRGFREPLPRSDGKRITMQQIYTLEPTQAGPSQIDPIVIAFTDKRQTGDDQLHRIETEAVTVEVLSTLDANSPSLAKLRGPQAPVPLPSSPTSWLWWLAGAIAIVVAAGAWLSHRRRAVPQPVLSPRELAEQELESLWKSGAARGEVKSFYVELTGIVRRFLERTTGIHAPEQTTEEFLREIVAQATFSHVERQRLKGFLEAADLVKFAAHRPDYNDVEEAFKKARLFVGPAKVEQPA